MATEHWTTSHLPKRELQPLDCTPSRLTNAQLHLSNPQHSTFPRSSMTLEITDGSSEASPSDLELVVSSIGQTAGLIGYKNVLSYTASLGIKVLPSKALCSSPWTKIGSGTYFTTYKGFLNEETGSVVAIK
jgi:hypothetical protein